MAFKAVITSVAVSALFLAAMPAQAKPTAYHPITAADLAYIDKVTPVPAEFDPVGFELTNPSHQPGNDSYQVRLNGKIVAILHYMPIHRVWEMCGSGNWGCKFNELDGFRVGRQNEWPIIVIDANTPVALRPELERHEIAHALGWRHN